MSDSKPNNAIRHSVAKKKFNKELYDVHLHVMLDEQQYNTLRKIADDNDRTITAQARWFVRRALKEAGGE